MNELRHIRFLHELTIGPHIKAVTERISQINLSLSFIFVQRGYTLKSSRFTAEAELISCAPESRVTYISFP